MIWSIRDKVSISNDEDRRIRTKLDEAIDISNEMTETAKQEAQSALKTKQFKADLDKAIFEELSLYGDMYKNGIHDEDDFEWTCYEAAVKVLSSPKYAPKTNALSQRYEKAYNDYYDEVDKVLEAMADRYSNLAKVSPRIAKKYQIDGMEIVRSASSWKIPGRLHDAERNMEETYHLGLEDEIDFSKVYSMEEYNRNHARN